MHNIFILFILSYSLIIAQSREPFLKIPITVSDRNNTIQLSVGIDSTATDGIDIHLGEGELPPLPPTGAFDVRLVGNNIGIPLFNGSLKDFRYGDFPVNQSIIHDINIQRGSSDTVNFNWNFPEGVSGLLQDFFGGIVVNVLLINSGNYTNTNPLVSDLKLTISYNIISDVKDNISLKDFQLFQNYPNPFNPYTTLKFQINERSNVTLCVYNILGEVLSELVNEELDIGLYEIHYDGRNIGSGIYIYKIQVGSHICSKMMTLIK